MVKWAPFVIEEQWKDSNGHRMGLSGTDTCRFCCIEGVNGTQTAMALGHRRYIILNADTIEEEIFKAPAEGATAFPGRIKSVRATGAQ
ncbi:hypothetical protein EVAR_73507_1 [Eumeta japonica]|uniref:Uncharacterized protein n=1 Tax=Eumeta variegata TaxID=151549 RepID=A0A4C1ST85_EUMVA|nr:hypothetical protein EVAR_73507_1 [Eumeta japonica]